MRELLVGIFLLAFWVAVQFLVKPASGWLHLLLIAGAVLVIRGVVLRDAERHG